MGEVDQLLRVAIEAIAIDRHGTVSWFGHREPVDRSLRRSMSEAELLDLARLRLQLRLYQSFYCCGAAVPVNDTDDFARADIDSFVDRLSAANCGRGVEERAWKRILDCGRSVIAEKNGLRLRLQSDRIRMRAGRISFRGLKELRGMSAGFYTALSNRPLIAQAVFRVYWNLRSDGAAPFIRAATRLFNNKAIPFRAKVLNDPGRFDRCDAAVIYVAKRDRRRAYLLLNVLYTRLRKFLKHSTPVFAKRIGRGVALAEDPAEGESFGFHRCGIVAGALVRAEQRHKTTTDARMREIADAFRRRGISIDQPFLNSGSRDAYPSLRDE